MASTSNMLESLFISNYGGLQFTQSKRRVFSYKTEPCKANGCIYHFFRVDKKDAHQLAVPNFIALVHNNTLIVTSHGIPINSRIGYLTITDLSTTEIVTMSYSDVLLDIVYVRHHTDVFGTRIHPLRQHDMNARPVANRFVQSDMYTVHRKCLNKQENVIPSTIIPVNLNETKLFEMFLCVIPHYLTIINQIDDAMSMSIAIDTIVPLIF